MHLRLLVIELRANRGIFDLHYQLIELRIATAWSLIQLKKFGGTEATHAKNVVVVTLLSDPIGIDLASTQLRIVSY